MVVTDLENASKQVALTPALQKGIEFLQQASGQTLEDGKIEIDGERVFAIVQSYETLDPNKPPLFEAHQAYIDIQYVGAGEEVIGWAPIELLKADKPFDGSVDAVLGTVPEDQVTRVRVAAGQLAVLYPADAHAPRLSHGAPSQVKKIVVKVAVGD